MAVDPNIKKKAQDIRQKIYGQEVRESLASGLESMSEDVVKNTQRQDEVEEQFQEVIENTTGKDVISAPEIINARNGEANLKARLDKEHQEVTAQLAQTDSQLTSLETANALTKIEFNNYLGNSQNMHPKVLHFPKQWNGYTFWMGYTPYENGNIETENPSIAVSNDGVNWTTPSGLSNPVEPVPSGDREYNSDTHLVYREDLNRIELWWRYVNENGAYYVIYRKTSTDGVNWGNKEVMWDTRADSVDVISPAVIYEGGLYKMWGVARTGTFTGSLVYTEKSEGGKWTNLRKIDIDWGGLSPWHGDVIKTDIGYEHVMSVRKSDGNQDLYYFYSKDNVTYSKPVKIMSVNKNKTAFDSGTLYRSSLLNIDGVYYLFYSARNEARVWGLSLSYGTDVRALNGFYNAAVLSGSNVKRITFDNNMSYIKKNELRMREVGDRGFTLAPDADKKHTAKVRTPDGTDGSGALDLGYVYFRKRQDVGNDLTWYEGALGYDGVTKKHVGYDGANWYPFDRFVNTAPSAYNSPGKKGDYAVTYSYLYVCYANNLWARFPTETGWT